MRDGKLHWFLATAASFVWTACATEVDAGAELVEVAAVAQAVVKGPYALDQEGNGSNFYKFDGVRAIIDIFPTTSSDGTVFTTIDYSFTNTLDRVSTVSVNYLILCEETPSTPRQWPDEHTLQPGEEVGYISQCALNAKAAMGFWIDN